MEKSIFPPEWNIIPGVENGKYPSISWKEYQQKQYPRDQLEKHNNKNYLAVCGKVSNNLFAIDLDYKRNIPGKNREESFLKIYKQFKDTYPDLADTRIHKTPHGHHILFYADFEVETQHYTNLYHKKKDTTVFTGKVLTNFNFYMKGIDIQGKGGLIMIPPSKIDSLEYQILNHAPVKSISKEEFEKVKNFFIIKQPKRMRQGFIDIINGEIEVERYASKHGQDEHVYWKMLYIEAYYRLDVNPSQLYEFLSRNQPAFDLKKTEKQVEYIDFNKHKPMQSETYKEYFPDYVGSKSESIFDANDIKEVEEYNKQILPQIDDPSKLNVKELTDIVANQLLSEFKIHTLQDSRQIMIKKNNHYSFIKNEFDHRFEELVRPLPKGRYTGYKHNILEMIRDTTLFNRDDFCTDVDLINFQNGVYDVVNERFKENFKGDFFYCIPYELDTSRKYDCPKFEEALIDWLVPEDRWPIIKFSDIYEMIGLAMSTHMGFKKAFLNLGDKDSGKTQFLNIIISLIGKENTTAVPLQRITKDQFGTNRLQMRILNACGELGQKAVKNTDIFKQLTGDDYLIGGEIKGGKQFEFRNYAKFWFNANQLPYIQNFNDNAFFERFIILYFPNNFKKEDKNYILKFYETICTHSEMMGIIQKSLKGLQRLIKRKGFRNEIQKRTRHIWLYESNSLYRFLYDYCNINKRARCDKDEFYEVYLDYGDDYITKRKLTIKLQRWGIISKRLRDQNGDRQYYYVNVELKDGIEALNYEKKTDGKINLDKLFGGG